MLVLGIETSCDETALGLVEDGQLVRGEVVASQLALHAAHGGVVPELAARSHVTELLPALEALLQQAGARLGDVDLVTVTHEPGLVGSLLVGAAAAKGLAIGAGLPLLAVHHLEGHVYANWLAGADGAAPPRLPAVCLIVSGGHSDLYELADHGRFRWLGGTRDDAAGEAFDKVGRLLGLPFPGGPAIERAALQGDPTAFAVPRAWLGDSLELSFSGVKTAMARLVAEQRDAAGGLGTQLTADLAASFQAAVIEVLVVKTARAVERCAAQQVIVGGGVGANRALLTALEARLGVPVACPPPAWCTDNGVMIAAAGWYRWQAGARSALDFDVRSVASLA